MLESVVSLPFNQLIGIQKSANGESLLEIPAGSQFLNHIGTVHASAQLALAEACSGEFLLQSLSGQSGIFPVVRRVEAKFKKPANGKIVAKVTTAAEAIEKAIAELTSKGRSLVSISVDILDEHGQHSLAASFDWFLAKTVS